MTSQERIRTTIRHEEPDRIPYFEQAISSRVASEILGREVHVGATGLHYDQVLAAMRGPDEAEALAQKILDDIIFMTREVGFDVVHLPWRWGAKPSKQLDEYTFMFGEEEASWDVYRYDPVSDTFGRLDSWLWHAGEAGVEKIVDAEEAAAENVARPGRGMGADFEYAREQLGPDYAYCGGGMIAIPMDAVWMEATATRPDLIERHLDAQLEPTLAAIEAGADAGVDFIWGGGDLAYEKGPWMSPAMFRRFHLPRLQKMTELCHRHGLHYVFRSDGNLWPIAEELFVESGVDGFGEIDSGHGMEVAEIVEKLPHLSIWGAIDCGELLVRGTKEDVIAEVKRQIDICGPGGGFVLMSSNTIMSNTPPENFLAMVETVREYGRYPLGGQPRRRG